HPVFWQRWVQERYTRVAIVGSDKATKNQLCRISQSPSLAQRVKHIYVKPWLVPPCTQSYQSRREIVRKHVSAFIDPHFAKKQAQHRLQKRFSKDIDWLQTALAGFPNVERYTLDWDGSAEFHPEFYEAFLIPVLRLWQPTLRQLILRLPPQMYDKLSQFSMPQLESLEVCLDTRSMDPMNVNIHLDALLVFIHNLKDSLHSLTIRTTPSSEGLDLSRLFRYIGTFPHLRSFSITIPFDGAHLSSIPPFTRFLQRHSETLESFALKTTRCSVHGKPVEHNGMNWIQAIVSSLNQPLPQLESLTLALRPLKAPLDLFRDFLRLNSSTLKHLVLTDRSLTRDEINHFILTPLSTHGRLKRLELRADSFSPQLLCSMATHLPNLHALKLSFAECNRNPALFHSALRACTCGISQWTLRHLTMSGGPDGAWVRSLEAVLVECIPAIESVQELIE
ncbi:hypothetical protein BKA70DRAFT_1033814, partial [Coprinopsis sp. MPI-PUGE-AT-0042]